MRISVMLVVASLLCSIIVSGTAERLSAKEPDGFKRDAYLHFLKGVMFEQEGNYEDALKEYTQTIQIDPGASYVHQSLSTLNIRVGNLDAALKAAERVQELEQNNPDAFFLTGSIYLVQEKNQEAERAFLKVLEIDPYHRDSLLHLAGLNVEKNPKKSAEFLERIIKVDPQAYDIYYELALLHAGKKSGYEKAIQNLKKSIEIDPGFFNAHLALAQIYEQKDMLRESIAAYEKSLALNPDNKLILAHVGLLYLQAGDTEKAEELYRQIADGGEEELGLLFWLGIMAEEKKNWPKAIEYVTESLKKKNDARSLLRLSYYHIQMGDRKKALQILEEVKKIDPSDANVRLFLAYAYQEKGLQEKAIAELEDLIAIDERSIEGHFQLGILYEQSGRFYKAIEHFEKTLALKPDHAAAANYLGYSLADRNIRIREAEQLIKKALEIEPDNPAYLDSLGWVLYRKGNFSEALAELSKASLKAEDPIIMEHLGDAQWAIAIASDGKGSLENAVRSWKNALKLKPEHSALKEKIRFVEQHGLRTMQHITAAVEPFTANQEAITDLSCFATIEGVYDKKPFSVKGMIFYKRNTALQVHLLGPMMRVWGTITLSENGFSVEPENAFFYFGTDTDVRSTAEAFLRYLKTYMDGSAGSELIRPGIIVEKKMKTYILSDNTLQAVLHRKKHVLTAYDYFALTGDRVTVRHKKIKKIGGSFIPCYFQYGVPERTLTFNLRLKKIKVNSSLPESVFSEPVEK